MARPFAWLDVFTATPMTGNGLAVVLEADGLDEATMLALARETDLSETTFVQSATVEGADYRNRIWTPMRELAFAGHPSLGTAVAVARARGDREARYVQQTPAGLQPVEVRVGDEKARASMLQGPAVFGAELDPAGVLGVLGLAAADADPSLPCQVVSCGQPHVMVALRDARALGGLRVDAAGLGELLASTGTTVLYVGALDGDRARFRSFLVQDGAVREDPATGSAAGPLMAHAHARTGVERLAIDQGVELGRPSRLDCAIEGDRVRVGGDVVVLAEGRITL